MEVNIINGPSETSIPRVVSLYDGKDKDEIIKGIVYSYLINAATYNEDNSVIVINIIDNLSNTITRMMSPLMGTNNHPVSVKNTIHKLVGDTPCIPESKVDNVVYNIFHDIGF